MPPAIQKQVQLPLRKAVDIALRSLRVRVGRSLLTILTIIMAIAFLTYIWSMRSFEPAARTAYLAAQGSLDPAPAPSVSRTLWLISLSLLVCTVGIANAMLMSVMERFREIGTMKCLGALDSFILKLFFLESLFLGAVGTVLGVLLGLVSSALMLLHSYGPLGWAHFHVATAGLIGLGAAGIGLLISAAAALLPAWKAARMEPVAAMRVDV